MTPYTATKSTERLRSHRTPLISCTALTGAHGHRNDHVQITRPVVRHRTLGAHPCHSQLHAPYLASSPLSKL